MNIKQPASLDLRAIFTAALNQRDAQPALWNSVMTGAFTDDGWHVDPGPDGRDDFHASEMGSCLRQIVLKHSGATIEPPRLESRLTFEIGKLYHASLQFGMLMLPEYDVEGIELGGHHPSWPLAGRADVAYRHGGTNLLVELKTESPYAREKRHKEADDAGIVGTWVRPEHWLQVAATAAVVRDVLGFDPEAAWVIYIDKSSGEMEQNAVPLNLESEGAVDLRLRTLVAARRRAIEDGELPPRLPQELKRPKGKPAYYKAPWQCTARGPNDPRGKWCPVRDACMTRTD